MSFSKCIFYKEKKNVVETKIQIRPFEMVPIHIGCQSFVVVTVENIRLTFKREKAF
jgi:hypothetical protein